MKKCFVLIGISLVSTFAIGAVAANAQVVYGIKHPPAGSETAYIYEINLETCVPTIMADPTLTTIPTASWNGNAYDMVNDRYYFSQFDNYPKILWRIDNFSTSPTLSSAGELSASISNGTFYDGKYYYIGHLTDDLYEVTFDANGNVIGETKLADISGANNRTWHFGDIAIGSDGMLYGSAAFPNSGGTREFFTWDGTTYTPHLSTGAPEALQIAFGDDGVLYGYAISNNKFYAMNTADGTLTEKCTSTIDFSDLASGLIRPCETDLMAGQHTDVGEVSIQNINGMLYITYTVQEPWCFTELHLEVADNPNLIPQKNGNPTPGKFEYYYYPAGGACENTYTFPPISECDGSFIGAHAAVKRMDGCITDCGGTEDTETGKCSDPACQKYVQFETAWGEGEDFPGKNWATYFNASDCLPKGCGP